MLEIFSVNTKNNLATRHYRYILIIPEKKKMLEYKKVQHGNDRHEGTAGNSVGGNGEDRTQRRQVDRAQPAGGRENLRGHAGRRREMHLPGSGRWSCLQTHTSPA